MTQAEVVNGFAKCSDAHEYAPHRRAFHRLTPEARRRAVENILAGDSISEAIRDAREFYRTRQEIEMGV